MQNPGATAGTGGQRETDQGLALLREAVLRLTQQAVRDPPTTAPTRQLTKLGPYDDVETFETFLETFERTTDRESWPEAQWAHILAPFLTGPAQQASQDLRPEIAGQYSALKQAILAYYGHNLAA